MRLVALLLVGLLVVLQWPLWFGKGGWLRVTELDRQLASQRESNHKLEARNAVLAAEVRSLREGREAVEERARLQLNMVRPDETFFQFVPPEAARKAPDPGLK
jgi:cell division protein FtsB